MSKSEKILELLTKDNPTNEEKKYLLESFDKEPELKKYESIFNLLNDMKNSFHLDSDLISEYVLYKNNLPLEDDSILKFIPRIEKHIAKCSQCQEEYKLFNEEYNEIDNYLNENIGKNVEDKTSISENNSAKIFSLFTNRYIYTAAAVIALFTFSVFTTSSFISPSYKNINELNSLNYSTTRGRVTPDFHSGLIALSNEKYNEAIAKLEQDIKNNADDKTIIYTNYMLGLVYLQKSESDFLGMFRTFDAEDIHNSIANFKEAISKNNSESFFNITLNSYFYIGKGYLLLDDFENAKVYLQNVVDNKGSYTKEAKEIIEIINNKM
jgi:tetratricopeptide (TPR) repeat protein